MNAIFPIPEKLTYTLTSATKLLLFIAVRSPVLRRQMGIELNDDGVIRFLPNFARPWLVPDYKGSTALSFDPDIYAKTLRHCSEGEHQMRVWLLNVWNPQYAKSKRQSFDFFRAFQILDGENLAAIAWLCQNPVLP